MEFDAELYSSINLFLIILTSSNDFIILYILFLVGETNININLPSKDTCGFA